MGTSDDVERVAAPVLQSAGLELIDVELRSGNVVVTVDREGGVDLDALAAASRAISERSTARASGPSSRYELEVSSPGLERRLRRPEHFRRFVGQLVAVRTMPGVEGERRLEGEIVAADDRRRRGDGAGPARRPAPRLRRHRTGSHGLRLEGGAGGNHLADGQPNSVERPGRHGRQSDARARGERRRTRYELDEFRPPRGAAADRGATRASRSTPCSTRSPTRSSPPTSGMPQRRRGGRRHDRPGLGRDPRLRPGARRGGQRHRASGTTLPTTSGGSPRRRPSR